jgi:hypothetical protein
MASNLLAMPFRPVINQLGGFESGATLTVYQAGTTTFQPIYSDDELTDLLSNPLTADGLGSFPPVYYSSTQPIRVIVKESDGTVLFDVDPYIATVFEAEEVLDQAGDILSLVETAAAEAEASASDAAISEAISFAFAGPRYNTTAEGIANTVDGDYFYVLDEDTIEVYLNDAETAVLQYSLVQSTTAIEDALAEKADLEHTHIIADVTGLQTALDAKAPLASPALTGTPTTGGLEIGTRKIPRKTTSGTLVLADNGGCVAVGAGITVPSGVFEDGHAVTIYNNTAGNITITQGSGLTLRQAATANTGNRTLAQRGLATIWFDSSSVAVISGPGVT